MSIVDHTKIERPVEPAFANEDPEGWCEVLAWEEARADKLEQENAELRAMLKRNKTAFLNQIELDLIKDSAKQETQEIADSINKLLTNYRKGE